MVRPLALLALLSTACAPPQLASTEQTATKGDIKGLSDEFDNPKTASDWQQISAVEKSGAEPFELFEVGRPAGWLTMMPRTSTWYKDYRGVLAFKSVDGDFVVTTKLRAHGRSGNQAPRSQFSLAGIMVRTPRNVTPQSWRPGGENYVFLSLGSADQTGAFQFEVKTTTNSDSQLRTVAANSGEATIRVARIGSSLILLINSGEGWRVFQRYSRPDMPGALQVGLTCYTDWPNASKLPPEQHNVTTIRTGNPDLTAEFDYVRYARPIVPADLKNSNLSDSGQVSDAKLLAFLGS